VKVTKMFQSPLQSLQRDALQSGLQYEYLLAK